MNICELRSLVVIWQHDSWPTRLPLWLDPTLQDSLGEPTVQMLYREWMRRHGKLILDQFHTAFVCWHCRLTIVFSVACARSSYNLLESFTKIYRQTLKQKLSDETGIYFLIFFFFIHDISSYIYQISLFFWMEKLIKYENLEDFLVLLSRF